MDWDYHPKFITNGDAVMEQLLPEVEPFIMKGVGTRLSCVFTSSGNSIYPELQTVDWPLSPTLTLIRNLLEQDFGTRFDYCLVHVYLNGSTGINWHNDKEALNSNIASISLGATRKFRFRKIDAPNGWDHEYHLNSGDLILMKPGCQRRWKHTVPIEKTVKNIRMNLTFRQSEF